MSFDTADAGGIVQIVCAETPGKAKVQALCSTDFEDVRFIDIACKRARWADSAETQLDLDIAQILHGWGCWTDYDDDQILIIDTDALPIVKKYGGIAGLIDAYYAGALTYDVENGRFTEED